MIEVKHVNKTFRLGDQKVHALNDIDLSIQSGEYISVMGPSGSGKSTLLNMLGLLDQPDNGEYWLKGINTVPLSEEEKATLRRDTIGFVFQSYHLIARLTARENIELPLVLAGTPPKDRRVKVDKILQQMGISDREKHLPHQLSGGQRQRVAIGRAIIMEPSLLLADEPTGNLDSQSGKEVVEVLEGLNQQGITLLVVTHDLDLGNRALRHLKMMDGAIEKDIHR